jgi:integrase
VRHVETTAAGTYKVRFRYGTSPKTGRPRQTSEKFRTHKEAEQFAKWLDALGPQGALDRLYESEPQAGDVPTLDKVAADHIELLTDVTPGTRKTYTRLWDRTWHQHIGQLPANTITRDHVSRAVNALARTYSRKSLENQRGLLAAVLDRAVDEGHLPKNPAKKIRLPRGNDTERVEMRILTADEFATILDNVGEHYRPLVNFLGATGCRWGEAVALQVQDVTLPNVRIRRALKWSPDNDRRVGSTKTLKSNRTVAIPAEIHDELRAACADKDRTDLVFTAPRGGPVLHRTFWSRVWRPAVEHLTPRPRIHDLRHSHAAWLLAARVPIHIVSRRLGHNNITTTVDVYGGLLPDAQAMASDAAALVFRRPDHCDHDSQYMTEHDGHGHWRCRRCGYVTECQRCNPARPPDQLEA